MNQPDEGDSAFGRRRSVLRKERGDTPQSTAPYRRKTSSALPRRLIPLLFFVVLAAVIAHNEIPAFAHWWERMLAPQDWQARQRCQQAALAAAANPAFARVIRAGEVHSTSAGWYVDRLVLGEMAEGGAEQAVEYSCYLDSTGKLVQLNRL